MRLLTAEQMREADRRTIEGIGIPGVVLMENAGRATADSLCRHFDARHPGPVLVIAGKGNNGGDGYVVARHLHERGWRTTTVVLAKAERISGDAAVFLRALTHEGAEVHFAPDDASWRRFLEQHGEPELIVDALFGTGLSSAVSGLAAEVIAWINSLPAPVVAVDIPSGIDASNGRISGPAVQADLTVTFAAAKVGHATYPGAALVGELAVAEIGIPQALLSECSGGYCFVEASEASAMLPARPVAGHKGTFGHLLVVAGAVGTVGAAAMTAEGGLRSGAGLVTVGCPLSIQKSLEVKLTEAMTAPLGDCSGRLDVTALGEIKGLWEGKKALALGPGIGTAVGTQALVRQVVSECPLPLVLDADGLNALTGDLEELRARRSRPTVLTPHPGEMARLSGLSIAQIESDRVSVARDFARRHGVTVILKGVRTVIAGPEGAVRINSSGNPALASGGMGDVLTGLVGGFLCQGLSALDSATLGVYLHGLAADRLARCQGEAGIKAGDLLRELPAARFSLLAKGDSDA